jgi:hypothetical protein
MDISALVANAAIALGLAALVGSVAQCLGALTRAEPTPVRLRRGGAILGGQPAR